MRRMQRLAVLSAVAVASVALAGCGGTSKNAAAPLPTRSTDLDTAYFTDTPTLASTDTESSSSVAASQTLGENADATVQDSNGYGYTVTVGGVYGRVTLPSGDNEIGVAVKISDPADGATFDTGYLGLGPATPADTDSSPWNFGTDATASDAADRIACAGRTPIKDALTAAGADSDPISGGVILHALMDPTGGCVTFPISQGDTPNMVGFFSDGEPADSTTQPDAEWQIHVPGANKAVTPPHGTVYAVTTDGGISIVTYNDGGGIEQVTSGLGASWSKNVGDVATPIMNAQLAYGSTISCTITVDGNVVSHHTSTGQYAVVSCEGG